MSEIVKAIGESIATSIRTKMSPADVAAYNAGIGSVMLDNVDRVDAKVQAINAELNETLASRTWTPEEIKEHRDSAKDRIATYKACLTPIKAS